MNLFKKNTHFLVVTIKLQHVTQICDFLDAVSVCLNSVILFSSDSSRIFSISIRFNSTIALI